MIDAHVHVWSLDAKRYPWQQTLPHVPIPTFPASVEMLLEEMDRAEVSHAVLVQPSVYGWNNDYLCDCLEKWPSRFVGVCLVDPRAEDAGERLDYWTTERGCRGLRINLIAERDPRWILDPDRNEIWQSARRLGITIALQILPAHAAIVTALAAAHPDITFIADYLGPGVFHESGAGAAIRQLAASPNVHYKILSAGQDSREPYPFRDLEPVYRTAAQSFGANRIVFGTDFPYLRQVCSYEDGIRWLGKLPFLDEAEKRSIGDTTARRLWGIGA